MQVNDLVLHINSGSLSSVQNAMSVVAKLRTANQSCLESFAPCFISAIRVIPDLDVVLTRQLVDIVASLVCAPSQVGTPFFICIYHIIALYEVFP